MKVIQAILTGAVLLLASSVMVAAETRLIMFEKTGCYWCARWQREIGPIYPKTVEGRLAPLTVLNVSRALPEGITLARRAAYTPTFVLLQDGVEVNRVEGYPGEDFFWGLLDMMLKEAGLNPVES